MTFVTIALFIFVWGMYRGLTDREANRRDIEEKSRTTRLPR